jgi:hypothetical protein
MKHGYGVVKKGVGVSALIAALLLLSVTLIPTAAAQSSGLGVGSGHGQEVGINLPALNQIKADAAAGLYSRPCTAAEHDPTKWHTLVNVEARCHYDHHHGDDPYYVSDIFGQPGAWFSSPGQSISYPWQTFPAQTASESNAAYLGTGQMENEAKHEGYYWIVRRDQPCNSANGQFCVKDFRVQFHGMMLGAGDVAARWHSMSAEVRVCRNVNDLSTCGIIRTGGWMDHGRLMTIDAGAVGNRALCGFDAQNTGRLQHIPLPADFQYFPLQTNSNPLDEARCHPILTQSMIDAGPRTGTIGDSAKAEWWVHGASDFRFQLQVVNPIGNIYPNAGGNPPLVNQIFCDFNAPDCAWNQSIMTMRLQYIVPVNSYYVQGFVNDTRVNLPLGRRYITRFGGINNSCTAPGLDCIPIEYSNLQVNVSPGQGLAGFSHTPCLNCQKVDHDISPAGQQWINWFYYKYGFATPTEPEPVPQPEEPTGPAIFFQVDDSSAGQVGVNVKLIGVNGVYGVQAECQVNPQVLTGGALVEGDGFNASNSFIINEGFQADGLWRVAATRLKPHSAISGNALAFSFNYNVTAAGDGSLQCSALSVDENGKALTIPVVNGTVIIAPEPQPQPNPPVEEPPVIVQVGAIQGVASYQNRADNAGITVKLIGINAATLDEVVTGADGAFSFPQLPVGQYTLEMLAPQHIPIVEPVLLDTADATVQLQKQLRAGDVDDNGRIDIVDVTLVGANFGVQAIPEIQHVDLNDDGWINVSDLSLAGGNLDLVSPLLNR